MGVLNSPGDVSCLLHAAADADTTEAFYRSVRGMGPFSLHTTSYDDMQIASRRGLKSLRECYVHR